MNSYKVTLTQTKRDRNLKGLLIKSQAKINKHNYYNNTNNRISCSNRNNSNDRNPNNSFVNKYINLTKSKFSLKFSLLISQIEEMRKEFIAQIEGIQEGIFSNDTLPSVIVNYQKVREVNKDRDISEKQIQNLQRKELNYQSPPNEMPKVYCSNYNMPKTKRNINGSFDEDNLNEYCTKTVGKINDNFQTCDNKSSITTIKKVKTIQKIKNKEKAFGIMIKNDMLDLDEKIKIKFLDKKIYNEAPSIKSIKENYQNFIEGKIQKIKEEYNTNEVLSMTSISNINFITLEKENEFINEQRESNKILYEVIYNLCGLKFKGKTSFKSCYEELKAKFKVNCLKELFIKILLPLIENLPSIKNEFLESSIDLMEKNMNQLNELSHFSFILNEMLAVFKHEILKRKMVEPYETQLLKVKLI